MKKILYKLFLITCISITINSSAQVLTKEDSLNAGLVAKDVSTLIGGYGEAAYRNDIDRKNASVNLTRNVIFIGHKFNNRISFFSETEIEDAKIEGGEAGGEISLEQAFIKFNINRNNYIAAGLFIPRIGTINENHLPTTFNTVARPRLETKLIPSTWRELGLSVYGNIPAISGLNYSAALMNGLNSANFEGGKGIRSGRFEGKDASASNLAITGALLYYVGNFRIQVSGYYGGSAGLSPREADSLRLNSGAFGTPVALEEANIQFRKSGFYASALFAAIQIPDANALNIAYAKNVPSAMMGYYAEAGYNLLEKTKYKNKKLISFVRYENFDLNAAIPSNAIENDQYKQSYLFAGLAFLPLPGVIVKADFEYQTTGEPNPALVINPSPVAPKYLTNRSFVNLGIGYSF
ncbi:MAG: hypothetical protein IPP56_02995 [Bacteroidetes bacterium]|nr:hypothetical protein [Bacteroidota bacterium]